MTPGVPISWPTVTSTTDSVRCPVELTYELWVDPNWVAVVTSPTPVEIQEDDYATYADPANPITATLRF